MVLLHHLRLVASNVLNIWLRKLETDFFFLKSKKKKLTILGTI